MRIKVLLLLAVFAVPTEARDAEKFAAYQQRLKDRRTVALHIRRQNTLLERYGPPPGSNCRPSRSSLYDVNYPSPRTRTRYQKPEDNEDGLGTALRRLESR